MNDVLLGGRLFNPINMDRRTVLIDTYLQRIVMQSGVDKLLPDADESNDHYVMRLHAQLAGSGMGCEILGGYLLPMGITERTWTAAIAADTVRHLEQCDTDEDRDHVGSLTTECVMFFFQQRLALLTNFLNSLPLRVEISHPPKNGWLMPNLGIHSLRSLRRKTSKLLNAFKRGH